MSIKLRLRALVARSNGNPIADALAKVAEKYVSAHKNVFIWDMDLNGELKAFRRIFDAIDGDVIDAGANAGQWAAAVLPFLGDRRLHCFEPIPQVFARLRSNLPEMPNIVLNNSGLGAKEASVEFNFSAGISEISSRFALVLEAGDQAKVLCSITTGDHYVAQNAIEKIALLKIDVEGMEMEVLQGFAETLRKRDIATVQFEHTISHILSGHTLKNFVDFFTGLDFEVFDIWPNAIRPLNYTLTRDTYEGRNYLAIRRDMVAKIIH